MMQGVEYYLIQPTAVLRARAEEKGGDFASIFGETRLLEAKTQPPRYPRDDYDRHAYVKVLFLASLTTDFRELNEEESSELIEFWDGSLPDTVDAFDLNWTIETVGAESIESLEADALEDPERLRATLPSGSRAVDAEVEELIRRRPVSRRS